MEKTSKLKQLIALAAAAVISAMAFAGAAPASPQNINEEEILNQANEAFDSAQYSKAMDLYQLIPNNPEAMYKMGRMYLNADALNNVKGDLSAFSHEINVYG